MGTYLYLYWIDRSKKIAKKTVLIIIKQTQHFEKELGSIFKNDKSRNTSKFDLNNKKRDKKRCNKTFQSILDWFALFY